MEFVFTEEQQMIGETARAFFVENATSERTRKAMAGDGIDHALWQSFCTELGFAGIALPAAHGGAGLGMVEFALVAEAAGAHVAALPLLSHMMAAQAIAAGGSDAQKTEWLPKMISGEAIATALVATDAQTHLAAHGSSADVILHAIGERAWLARSNNAGITVTPMTTMDQTRPFAHIAFDSAELEALEDGPAATQAARVAGWICLAAEALGGAQACLDRTIAYAKERVQFGRPIGSFQAYKHRLADMMIEIEQARSAVYWAACAVDEGSEEAGIALHAAKSFCGDTFFMCASNMIQLHGGIGFTWEHNAHLYFKRARSIQTMLGHGNFHREQVAEMILGEAA